MTRSAEHLPGNCEDLSSSLKRLGPVIPVTVSWEAETARSREAPWPASLACLGTAQANGGSYHKQEVESTWRLIPKAILQPPHEVHRYTRVCTHEHTDVSF